jgi:AcrR family transcriptional regulator
MTSSSQASQSQSVTRGGSATTSPSEILAVAAALFRRKGYSQSTTREIATLLGLKKASLYHYVESKEDLLYDICIHSIRNIIGEVTAAVDAAPPALRLERAISAHIESALRDSDMHVVMLMEMRALSPAKLATVIAHRDDYESRIRALIAEDQQRGKVRPDIPTKYLTLSLLSMLNWVGLWYQPTGPLKPAELGELLMLVFLDGTRVRQAQPDGENGIHGDLIGHDVPS